MTTLLASSTLNLSSATTQLEAIKASVGYHLNDELHQLAAATAMHELPLPSAIARGVSCFIRRDDDIDVFESGNKRYKLFYNLLFAKNHGYSTLASFGGAWSNHLFALAAAGRRAGFTTHGIIRGERPRQLSGLLADIQQMGMTLHFIDRQAYAVKQLPEALSHENIFVIPEGGNNILGALGMSAVGRAVSDRWPKADVCLPVGTGASLAGVAAGLQTKQRALGFSVLKGEGSLGAEIRQTHDRLATANGSSRASWALIHGFHGGGYGRKLPSYLVEFLEYCECLWPQLLWDPVYTLKMLWGVDSLLKQGYWRRGQRLVLVHTGGLQGRRGFGL